MAERLPSLWYPEASVAKDASLVDAEEGGRGSSRTSPVEEGTHSKKKLPMIRRRTPTVVVPNLAKVSKAPCLSSKPKPKQPESGSLPKIVKQPETETYDTVEKVEEITLLDLSALPYQSSNLPPAKKYPNWFCGWTDEEYFDLHRDTTPKPPPREVSRTQTPATGTRSYIYSRTAYSSALRKPTPYKFKHFSSYEEYAQEYRLEYSYTSLHVPRKSPLEKEATKPTPEVAYKVVNERATVTLPIEMKSVYHEDPYFAELVSRLGIKEPPKSRGGMVDGDQNLLQGMKPTPPSIVKKRRNVEIVVANSRKCSDKSVSARPATSDGQYSKMVTPSSGHSHRQMSSRVTQTTQISQYIHNIYTEHKKKKRQQKEQQQETVIHRYLQMKARLNDALLEENEEENREMSDIDERGEDVEEGLVMTITSNDDNIKATEKPYGKDGFKDEQLHDNYNSRKDKRLVCTEDTADDIQLVKDSKNNHSNPDSCSAEGNHSSTNNRKKSKHMENSKCLVQRTNAPKISLNAKNCLDLDSKERERIMSDTAYLLGVGSRDWAKTYLKKIMTSDPLTRERGGAGTRPPTRQSRAVSRMEYRKSIQSGTGTGNASQLPSRAASRMGQRNQLQSRTGSRMSNRNGMKEESHSIKTSEDAASATADSIPPLPARSHSKTSSHNIRPQTNRQIERFQAKTLPEVAARNEKKIEELKSIYKPAASKKATSSKERSAQSDTRHGVQGRAGISRCASRQGRGTSYGMTAYQTLPSTQEATTPRYRQGTDQSSGAKPLPQLSTRKPQRPQKLRMLQPNTSITSLDGSCLYWSEVPRVSRPPTSMGRQTTNLTEVKEKDEGRGLPLISSNHHHGNLAPPSTPVPLAATRQDSFPDIQ